MKVVIGSIHIGRAMEGEQWFTVRRGFEPHDMRSASVRLRAPQMRRLAAMLLRAADKIERKKK